MYFPQDFCTAKNYGKLLNFCFPYIKLKFGIPYLQVSLIVSCQGKLYTAQIFVRIIQSFASALLSQKWKYLITHKYTAEKVG